MSGTVTSTESWTIALPTGATPDEVAAAEDAVAAANDQLAMARTELAAATRARTLVKARDDAAVGASPPGAPRREAVRTRSLDRIDQDRAVTAARAALADAQRAVAAATRDLAARRTIRGVAWGDGHQPAGARDRPWPAARPCTRSMAARPSS